MVTSSKSTDFKISFLWMVGSFFAIESQAGSFLEVAKLGKMITMTISFTRYNAIQNSNIF